MKPPPWNAVHSLCNPGFDFASVPEAGEDGSAEVDLLALSCEERSPGPALREVLRSAKQVIGSDFATACYRLARQSQNPPQHLAEGCSESILRMIAALPLPSGEPGQTTNRALRVIHWGALVTKLAGDENYNWPISGTAKRAALASQR